jgi:hypothetical protein
MINLYYTPSSGSISSSLYVYSDSTIIQPSEYTDITLEISASGYETSGSTFTSTVGDLRVYVRSGSIIYASFPIEETNIYYVISGSSVLPPFFPNPQPEISNTSSFDLNFDFSPISNPTSSNDKFQILSGSTVVFSISGGFSNGTTPLTVGQTYTAVLSGSGTFYTSSISIINTLDSTIVSYVTSSNSYLTASFSSSIYFNGINIIPKTETFPFLQLTYNDIANIPVAPTNSLDGWNTYLNVSASIISSSGATIYVAGGYIGDIINLSVDPTYLVNFTSSRLSNLNTLDLSRPLEPTGSLTSFPNLSELTVLQNINLTRNNITGSVPSSYSSSYNIQEFSCSWNNISGSITNILNILPTSSIRIVNVSNNSLTGSIPNLSASFFLSYFDCSSNKLSGSILPQTHYSLSTFLCNNNALTGSIPDLSNIYNLSYFDASNNKLTGQLPNLSSSYNLSYFNCQLNQLTGSIPPLTGSLQTFYCIANQLSGSIGSLNGATNLVNFDCGVNALTGSIPYLVSCSNLVYFNCSDNKLSDYSGSSGGGFATGPGVSPTLTSFYAQNNQLKAIDVDNILYDLDKSGATNGVVNLSGSANAAPTVFGLSYTASLVSKGWLVYVN